MLVGDRLDDSPTHSFWPTTCYRRHLFQPGSLYVWHLYSVFFTVDHGIVLTLDIRIVVITAIVVASTASAISDKFGSFSRVGGIIGSTVSATFLVVLGVMNVYILVKLLHQLRKVINSPADAQEPEFKIEGAGCVFRSLKGMFKLIDQYVRPSKLYKWTCTNTSGSPAKMYPLGALFGLGFDTSSEIGSASSNSATQMVILTNYVSALLGISAISASQGTNIWLILLFPVLFTAGMCLLDTLDGALMMSLYTSARLAKDAIAVYYFQTVLTGVTVIVALIIGVLQFLGMLQGATGLEGGFWDGVVRASDNYDIIGQFSTT